MACSMCASCRWQVQRGAAGASAPQVAWRQAGRRSTQRSTPASSIAATGLLDAPTLEAAATAVLSAGAAPAAAAASATAAAAGAAQPLFQLSSAGLFELINQTDELVAQQLTGLTPLSFAIVLGAGLLTSLSPCTLSVLPLTIGYIGGYSGSGGAAAKSSSGNSGNSGSGAAETSLVVRAGAFSAGLATTLAALGVASSLLGGAYGQIGDGLPIAVSLVAVAMGLNLLEVLPLRLPSLDVDVRQLGVPPAAQAYLAGLTFALAASPCSTPILATLLAFVSTSRDPVTGGALLFAYTLGYVSPLLAAALFTGALQRLLAMRQWSAVITPASGVLLLAGGTYGLLTRLVPA